MGVRVKHSFGDGHPPTRRAASGGLAHMSSASPPPSTSPSFSVMMQRDERRRRDGCVGVQAPGGTADADEMEWRFIARVALRRLFTPLVHLTPSPIRKGFYRMVVARRAMGAWAAPVGESSSLAFVMTTPTERLERPREIDLTVDIIQGGLTEKKSRCVWVF